MENFENSSPINLSTRPIERDVLKDLNKLEGINKSAKRLAPTDDTATQYKDANISSNLPDIVNNVDVDVSRAENKNLLNVATTPDIQSDDEYVDCNSTLRSDISGVAVNRTIDNVSKILDETIQILGNHGITPNDANSTVCIVNEKFNEGFIDVTNSFTDKSNSEVNRNTSHVNDDSGNITQNQSKDTSGTETTDSKENDKQEINSPIIESKETNETLNITSYSDHPLVERADTKSTSTTPDINTKLVSSQVNESTITEVNDSAAVVIDSQNDAGPRTTLVVEEAKIDAKFNDVELNSLSKSENFSTLSNAEDCCHQETTFILPDNDVEPNPKEIEALPDKSGLKQQKIEEFKANHTISIDSLDLDSETRDCSLDSLDMKQPLNGQVTQPAEKCVQDLTADEILSSQISNLDQATKLRYSLSRQSAVSLSSPIVCTEQDTSLFTNKIELQNVKSPNKFPSNINCDNCVIPPTPDDAPFILEEKCPNGDLDGSNKLNESSGHVIREDTFSLELENNEDPCAEEVSSSSTHSSTRGETLNVTIPMNSTDKSSLPADLYSSDDYLYREEGFLLPVSKTVESACKTTSSQNPATTKLSDEQKTDAGEINPPGRLMRRATFNLPVTVFPNNTDLEEMLSNGDLDTSNRLLRKDTSPMLEPENNRDPCVEEINSDILDTTNRLTRSETFNATIPVNCSDKSSTLMALPVDLNLTDDSLRRQETFSLPISTIDESVYKAPETQIPAVRKLKDEKQTGVGDTFMSLNSNDFDFLQSRGANCVDTQEDRRNSLLLRFDPLSSRRSEFKPTEQIINETLNSVEVNGNKVTADSASAEGKTAHDQSASQLSDELPSNNILVEVTNTMENEANGYLDNIRAEKNEDKLISVGGVTDKKNNFECTDEDIQNKMEEYEANKQKLLKLIAEKDKAITKSNTVIELYEKAIAEALAAKEKRSQTYEKQNEELKTDRDLNCQHLMSLESTFADLHMKFERQIQCTTQLQEKVNSVSDEKAKAEDLLKQQELRYDKMKSHTMQQFDIANTKLEQQTKTISMENTKLKAQIKREEIQKTAVQEELSQKKKENEELVKICDELISGQRS